MNILFTGKPVRGNIIEYLTFFSYTTDSLIGYICLKKAYFLKHELTAVSTAPAKIRKSPILKTILRNFSGPKLKRT